MGRLNLRLMPGSRIKPDDMDELVDMVWEDLAKAKLTDAQFSSAVTEWRSMSPFVPTSADLLKVHQDLAAKAPKPKLLALPQEDAHSYCDRMLPVMQRTRELHEKGMGYPQAFARAMRECGRKSPEQAKLLG